MDRLIIKLTIVYYILRMSDDNMHRWYILGRESDEETVRCVLVR